MKVCIIGDGLTSLTLAKALVNRDIFVDVLYEENNKNYNQTRTLGISKSNIEFFNNYILNINKILWKIDNIKIFTENSKNEEIIDFSESKKLLFSILQNDLLNKYLKKELKKSKFFNLKKKIKYHQLKKKKYNLIINCDSNNEISKKFFTNKIEKDYNSIAYTAIIEHKKIVPNSSAVQIFTNNGPIAFLPISNIKTSIVYSVRGANRFKKDEINKVIEKFNFKFNIKNISEISQFKIKSSNLRQYYYKNILAFGDLLHKIHPLAGQGFNMSLRDIKVLIDLIENRISLGLDIDSSICREFQKKTKDKNYIFSKGIDWIYEFFKFESKIKNQTLNLSIKKILKQKNFNNFFKKFADIGIRT